MKNVLDLSLKHLFGEELPKEQNFLLIEDIDARGEILLLDLIKNFVSLDYNTILVLLDAIPFSLLKEIVTKESDNFAIVNTYSDLHSKYYTSIKLHELNLTLKALRRQVKSEKGLVIFYWSLNPLFIYYSSTDVVHFYLENIKHSIENETMEFYLIGKGLVEDIIMRRLIAMSHCVLRLEKNNLPGNPFKINYLKAMSLNVKQKELAYDIELGKSIWDHRISFY